MRTIKIGRSNTNDCVFANSTVSGSHATLTLNPSGVKGNLRDLNSKNGTFVNNRRITSDVTITDQDIVRFGTEETSLSAIIAKSNETKVQVNSRAHKPGQCIIGKNPECDIRFQHDDVSREHAIIYKTETGDIVIEDCGSTNGTYVNGLKITSKVLQPGDKVTITRNYPLDWESIYSPAQPHPTPSFNWLRIVAMFVLGVVLVGGGVWAWNEYHTIKPEDIFKRYKKSVVFIYNKYAFNVTVGDNDLSDVVSGLPDNYYIDGNGEIKAGVTGSSGTGFFVSQDGKIVTNNHVVSLMGNEDAIAKYIKKELSELLLAVYGKEARKVVNAMEVKYIQSISIAMNDAHLGSEKDLLPCTLISTSDNKDIDVAVIQLNTKETPSSVKNIIDIDKIATERSLSIGSELCAIGFPNGLEWALTQQGIQATLEIGSVNQDVSEYLYGHNINITHGASGSPVFDKKGRFAGIIVSGASYQSISPSGEVNQIAVQHNQAIRPQHVVSFVKTVY